MAQDRSMWLRQRQLPGPDLHHGTLEKVLMLQPVDGFHPALPDFTILSFCSCDALGDPWGLSFLTAVQRAPAMLLGTVIFP